MGIAYTGGAQNGGTSAAPSVTHGLTINSGDLVVAYVTSNSTTAIAADVGGALFDEVVDEIPSSETARQALFWKIANDNEPSSYSFTSGNAEWRVLVKVFSSGFPMIVDAPANTHRQGSAATDQNCGAADGESISAGALSLIFGGKDNRGSDEAMTGADNSYVSPLGNLASQVTASAHRIYSTDTTFSGDIIISGTTGLSDNTYSIHISFVESDPVDKIDLGPAVIRNGGPRRFQQAARVDGSGVDIKLTSGILIEPESYSVGAWFYVDVDRTGNNRVLLAVEDSDSSSVEGVLFGWNASNVLQIINDDTSANFTNAPPIGEWFYAVLVSNGAVDAAAWFTKEGIFVEQQVITHATWSGSIGNIQALNSASDIWVDGRVHDLIIFDSAVGASNFPSILKNSEIEDPVLRQSLRHHFPLNGDARDVIGHQLLNSFDTHFVPGYQLSAPKTDLIIPPRPKRKLVVF